LRRGSACANSVATRKRASLPHALTTPLPHFRRPTHFGRSAAAKDTTYTTRHPATSTDWPGRSLGRPRAPPRTRRVGTVRRAAARRAPRPTRRATARSGGVRGASSSLDDDDDDGAPRCAAKFAASAAACSARRLNWLWPIGQRGDGANSAKSQKDTHVGSI